MQRKSVIRAANLNKSLFVSMVLSAFLLFPTIRAVRAQTPPPTSAVNSIGKDWKRYQVKDEEFSVLLPQTPAMTTRTAYLIKIDKERRERILGAYADGVGYAIYCFDNRNAKRSLDQLIQEFSNHWVGSESGQVSLDGFPGKEFRFKSNDNSAKTQFYLTEQQIYVFQVIASNLADVDGSAAKFLSSITLKKKLEGITIVDGPGDQPDSSPTPHNADGTQSPLSGRNVTVKASVITKPEPTYTEEARRNQIMGTIVIRCVFRSSGAVTDLKIVSGLPFGLNEKALESARQIRFIPAIKDGHFVSMYIQLEYNFNLY